MLFLVFLYLFHLLNLNLLTIRFLILFSSEKKQILLTLILHCICVNVFMMCTFYFLLPKSLGQANVVSCMAVSDECKLKFMELIAKRNCRFIIFKIENQEVVVEKLGIPDEAYEDFTTSQPASERRYAVFNLDFITDQSFQKGKLFFIAW